MAFVSSFPCKPTSLALKSQLKSKSTLYPINTVRVTSNHINHFSKICITGYSTKNQRRIFKAQAVDGDSNKAVGEDVDETVGFEATKEPSEIDLLKKALFDSLNRTDSSDTRADIIELITQLEAKNPTPAPTQASTLLNGKWILAYTSIAGLIPSMASVSRPLVKIEQIFEIIHTENFTVQASVLFAGPFGTSTFSANGKLEVRGPKRLQVKFEEGIIESPQFKDSTELPDEVEIIGHKMNLSPVKGLITSLQDVASSVARTISSQPPVKFPITCDSAQFWLLTTYLDEELRISRADGGSVFVECISR